MADTRRKRHRHSIYVYPPQLLFISQSNPKVTRIFHEKSERVAKGQNKRLDELTKQINFVGVMSEEMKLALCTVIVRVNELFDVRASFFTISIASAIFCK